MKIWILQTGEPLQIDKNGLRPMRAINLSNELIKRGHEVTLWSSDFDHFSKSHRFGKMTTIQHSDLMRIRLIASRGYAKNIGISRLIDHFQLGLNLWRMLRKESKPDLGFVGYPPIEPAWIMTRFLEKNSVPSVLDVKDAWPEVLLRGFPRRVRFLAKMLLKPYFLIMRSTFKRSRFFSSISPEFLNWVLGESQRARNVYDRVNYLSSNQVNFSKEEITEAENYWDLLGIRDDGNFRCSYIGSLTGTLDFRRVFEAASETEVEFVIAGSGSQEEFFKDQSRELQNVFFPGWVSGVQALVLAQRSTILIAPYMELDDFKISLPNKFIDSMMYGRPMFTSLSGFPKEFIQNNKIGKFYSINETGSFTTLIKEFSIDRSSLSEMGLNAKKLFDHSFNGDIIYANLVDYLEQIVELKSEVGDR
jgi:glycosyltransferase involved in cell wall biosynthesis